MKYWFYRCTNPECRMWYCTNREIKGRKCIICNKYFPFKDAEKKCFDCSPSVSVNIIKFLKEEEWKKHE